MEYVIKLVSKLAGFDLASLVVLFALFNSLVFVTQSFLDGVVKVLNEYKDKTKTDVDNKAVAIVSGLSAQLTKLLQVLSKLLDVVGANKKH